LVLLQCSWKFNRQSQALSSVLIVTDNGQRAVLLGKGLSGVQENSLFSTGRVSSGDESEQ
jgi:hypothetical protein